MFNNLMKFDYKRNVKEAVGFYFTYLFFLILISFLIGSFLGILLGEVILHYGFLIGQSIAVIACIVFSFLILKGKGLLNNLLFIIIALLGGAFAVLSGALGGLLPVAYLTTVSKKGEGERSGEEKMDAPEKIPEQQ